MVQPTDWDKYKFHCHTLPKLMVTAKAKDEILGETAKSHLIDIWEKERWGRESFGHVNNFTKKGIAVESDSIQLYQDVKGGAIFKNTRTFENEFLVGTPDLVSPLKDIKSSWDTHTFLGTKEQKAKADYFWQLAGYMMLTGEKRAELVYCLVTTPQEISEDVFYRMSYSLDESQIAIERLAHDVGDIPKEQRVRSWFFEASESDFEKIERHCVAAREYLKALDIEFKWKPFNKLAPIIK